MEKHSSELKVLKDYWSKSTDGQKNCMGLSPTKGAITLLRYTFRPLESILLIAVRTLSHDFRSSCMLSTSLVLSMDFIC